MIMITQTEFINENNNNNNNNSSGNNDKHQNNGKSSQLVSQLSSASNTFSIQSNTILCRICYTTEKKEPLLHPCNCSGTMGLVHKSCLEKWLASSNSNQCEICQFKFTVVRKCRPFSAWISTPSDENDYRNFMSDLICFFILTPLAGISTWLCALGALRYHEWDTKWEAIGLVALTCFLVNIYLIWCFVTVRYHYKLFREWQSRNHIVTLEMTALANTIQIHTATSSPSATSTNSIRLHDLNKIGLASQLQQDNVSQNSLNSPLITSTQSLNNEQSTQTSSSTKQQQQQQNKYQPLTNRYFAAENPVFSKEKPDVLIYETNETK